jgi:hypothetical protein
MHSRVSVTRHKAPRLFLLVLMPLAALAAMAVPACGPTGNGDIPCGQLDLDQNGQFEMCGSMSDCPGSDLCVGGFCVGSVCEAGTCEPGTSGHPYACTSGAAEAGPSRDAAKDSHADAPDDHTTHDAHADASRKSDATKDHEAEEAAEQGDTGEVGDGGAIGEAGEGGE